MRLSQLFAGVAFALFSSLALANPDQAIRTTLQALQPELQVESISPSPMQGLYEVRLEGGRVLYASPDGQFIVQGNLYQVKNGQPSNLTEAVERLGVAKSINAIPSSEMVIFPAKGQTKAHITVFTDTTCPYCQKLHAEVPKLNEQGIEVRYLAFPRQGPGSEGDRQLQAVWCAKDRQKAMDQMLEGQAVNSEACSNPVIKQMQLGHVVGVQGTPAIILADGSMLPGYQPAKELIKLVLQAK